MDRENLGVESEGGLPAKAERVGAGLFLRILVQRWSQENLARIRWLKSIKAKGGK